MEVTANNHRDTPTIEGFVGNRRDVTV